MNTPGRSLYVRLHGPESGPGAAGKWTDAATGEHGDLLDLIARNRDLAPSRRGHGRGALLPRLAASAEPAHRATPTVAGAERIARGRPPSVPCRPPGSRHAGRGLSARPRHHRHGSTGPPCAITRPSITAQPRTLRSKSGRPCSPPSPISTARITGILRTWLDPLRPAKAPLADPRRALGHLLGNGVRFGIADRRPRRRRRHRDHARAQIRAALAADGRRALGQPPRRPRSAPRRCAASMSRATTTRPVCKAADRLHERGAAAGIDVRDLVPVHADFNLDLCRLGPAAMLAHLDRPARPVRPGAFPAATASRSAPVSVIAPVRPVSCRNEERLSFVAAGCLGRPEKSRAGGLPERRSAGGAGRR